MTVQIISFYEAEKKESLRGIPGAVPLYSQVWEVLHKHYGNPVNMKIDGYGSCFRDRTGSTAVLTDKSPETPIHELVLIDVPAEVVAGLEKVIKSFGKK